MQKKFYITIAIFVTAFVIMGRYTIHLEKEAMYSTAFERAKKGKIETIRSHIRAQNDPAAYYYNINYQNETGETLLHIAVIYPDARKTTMANDLLAGGIDPNIQDQDGNTALHLAIMSGNVMAAKALLAYGAKTNIHNNKDETVVNIIEKIPSVEMKQKFKHCLFFNLSSLEISGL